jgi:hypothetical protein
MTHKKQFFLLIGLAIIAIGVVLSFRYGIFDEQVSSTQVVIPDSVLVMKQFFDSPACSQTCIGGIEIGSTQAQLEAKLKEIQIPFQKKETIVDTYYTFINEYYVAMGGAASITATVSKGILLEMIVHPMQLCTERVFEALGHPTMWYRSEIAYELYYPNLYTVVYVRQDKLGQVASLRLLGENAFIGLTMGVPFEVWSPEMSTQFKCGQ